MKFIDYSILLMILSCLVLAVVSMRRQKKKGGCAGCGSGCGDCSGCSYKNNRKPKTGKDRINENTRNR